MELNINLKKKVEQFPENIQDIALMILKEMDKDQSIKQIERKIMNEIVQLVAEEED